ncbi:MAG: hypothetical protein ACKODU_04675 [Limnohabitans sp.]
MKPQDQFTGLAGLDLNGRCPACLMAVIMSRRLLHLLGVCLNLLCCTQHQFMRHSTGVVDHEAHRLSGLKLQLVRIKPHFVVHTDFHNPRAAKDQNLRPAPDLLPNEK